MHRRARKLPTWLPVAILAAAATCGPSPADAPAGPSAHVFTVFAAASVADLMEDLRPRMEAVAGRPVRISAAASGTLARQILQGAPADLFVSASPRWMAEVAAAGLLAPGRQGATPWLSNRLACVIRVGSAWMPQSSADLAAPQCRALALAIESAPVGVYAREALAAAGVDVHARVVAGMNARDTLAKVSLGGADAGIVYATDARLDDRVRVAFTFDPALHAPIVYPLGCLNGHHVAACDRVVAFLQSADAAATVTAHGFAPAAP